MWEWVDGIGDCGCGSMGCMDSSVISLFFGVFFTGFYFFLFFGWMLVSILLHSGGPEASILMMVVT